MIFGLATLLTAISISIVAAYYSILGLTAIFAAAFLPIVIMGAALEAGKIMATVWLHRNWQRAQLQYKLYLVPAVFLLMFITSMGIFGFLSKAHIEQTASGQESVAQAQRIDTEIARQTAVVQRAEDRLTKLETTGSGQDATIQSQIDAEKVRIDSAYARVQPAIAEQQLIVDQQLKLYQDQLAQIDNQLQTLQDHINAGDIRKAQGMVGTRADGQFGPATAAAFQRWQSVKSQERAQVLDKLASVNDDPVVQLARTEIARLRGLAETQIADSNKLISRLRDQLGQNTTAQELSAQLQEQQNIIRSANTELDRLTQQKYQLQAEYRKLEAEVGPVKYIAEFIYGEQADKNTLEQAVRWVILLLVLVFDPLALVLILAGTKQIEWSWSDRRKKRQQAELIDHNAELVTQYQHQTESMAVKIQQLSQQLQDTTAQRDFWQSGSEKTAAELAELVANLPEPGTDQSDLSQQIYDLTQSLHEKHSRLREQELELIGIRTQMHALQTDHDKLMSESERTLLREFDLQQQLDLLTAENQQLRDTAVPVVTDVPETTKLPKFIPPPVPETKLSRPVPEPEPIVEPAVEPAVGFGNDFPQEPAKGDLFLRVDFKPSRLFRWNDSQWIQTNKNFTDTYVYHHDYMEFLREKLRTGEYDWDDLSPAEQDRIQDK